MKIHPFLLMLVIGTTAWSAAITFAASPDPSSVDLVIGALGGSQVGAYDLRIDYDLHIVTIGSAQSLGFLGVPGIETIWQSQSTVIGPSIEELELTEVSLLSSAELISLQPATFGLARLSLVGPVTGTAVLSVSGIISDAAGNPIVTTFTPGVVCSVPEPATLTLFIVAGTLLFLCSFASGKKRSFLHHVNDEGLRARV
jgi:hypothetical protein